jgi:hypothetical protein
VIREDCLGSRTPQSVLRAYKKKPTIHFLPNIPILESREFAWCDPPRWSACPVHVYCCQHVLLGHLLCPMRPNLV